MGRWAVLSVEGAVRGKVNGRVVRIVQAVAVGGATVGGRQVGVAHVGDVGEEGGVDDKVDGRDDAVGLGAVLDDQRVRDVGIEHDRVGRHQQHAGHHALAVGDVAHVDLEKSIQKSINAIYRRPTTPSSTLRNFSCSARSLTRSASKSTGGGGPWPASTASTASLPSSTPSGGGSEPIDDTERRGDSGARRTSKKAVGKRTQRPMT